MPVLIIFDLFLLAVSSYRWFPEGKVVFVAPTKPLVAQQVMACHGTCGIPAKDSIELTGNVLGTTRIRYVSCVPFVGVVQSFSSD